MTNVGIAGIGFMGMIHYLAYQKTAGAKVAAMCEQDATRLAGDWTSIKGNFGPPGKKMDLSGVSKYAELDEMLADDSLDMIDICLPPSWHAEVAIKAFEAGKHVFCEKPIAMKTDDAEAMVDAARRAGRQLYIGHVLPYFPEYQFALNAITAGTYGKLLGGHFKRVISDPTWLPDFYNPETVGGPMLDLHIHDAHFIRLVCGMPRAVHSVGSMRGQVAERFESQFLFDDTDLVVTASSGVINQQGRPFTHAYEIYLEQATLLFDFAVLGETPVMSIPVTVLEADGTVSQPDLGAGDPVDAFVAEITEVITRVTADEPSPILDGSLARDALILCNRQTESIASRCDG